MKSAIVYLFSCILRTCAAFLHRAAYLCEQTLTELQGAEDLEAVNELFSISCISEAWDIPLGRVHELIRGGQLKTRDTATGVKITLPSAMALAHLSPIVIGSGDCVPSTVTADLPLSPTECIERNILELNEGDPGSGVSKKLRAPELP